MIGLCIAEPYYILGLCRIEYFSDEKLLTAYRAKLNQGVTTWILGEPVPKRRMVV
jgi:hypothetical protein